MYLVHGPAPDHGCLLRKCCTAFPTDYSHLGGRSILSWRNYTQASIDAVICRNGLTHLPHLQAALEGMRRVLKPGGKLAALVWSRNPFHLLPLTILAKYAGKASANLPNPFALSDPAVFEQALREAGF